jgi:two-component system chemotaxis sensor kinase CheA
MQEQLDAYKSSTEPDAASFEYICNALRQLALEAKGQAVPAATNSAKLSVVESAVQDAEAAAPASAADDGKLRIVLSRLKENEVSLLEEELGNLGTLTDVVKGTDTLSVTLDGGVSQDDIIAVLCFVIEADQIAFENASVAVETAAAESAPVEAVEEAVPAATAAPAPVVQAAPVPALKAVAKEQPAGREKPARGSESTSIRVAVEKVDQLINLVGELVITQSMLAQRSNELDPVTHGDLITSMTQLQRNARDLQESVMSIRMMPMEYVFSRFPRLVRDLASKLDKQVELTLQGSSTELDKSLIERIIDPLTHLVRNSLDHGIEVPEKRVAAGKSPIGNLTLSAEHQGGISASKSPMMVRV